MILVSNNGSSFQSDEFKSFEEANRILHRRVLPYHPASFGAAKNLVKSVQISLEKGKPTDSVETKIARFQEQISNNHRKDSSRNSVMESSTNLSILSPPMLISNIDMKGRIENR